MSSGVIRESFFIGKRMPIFPPSLSTRADGCTPMIGPPIGSRLCRRHANQRQIVDRALHSAKN